MSFNGLAASFLPFTINGLTDATFSSSNIGDAIATTLQVTSATPLKLARFNADRELVSASVDESEVALLVGNNTFKGSQTILPGSITNINNVITTAITSEAYTEASFTTSGISGYTPPLGTLSGPTAGEYSISQTANDRSVMRINGFVPTVKTWVYTFMIRIVDTAEGYLSVEQSGVQRSSTIRLITPELTTISDTFTYDPSSGPVVFKIYTGSLDPWSASWSSFTLGSYTVAITAPLSAPLVATAISTTTIGTEILSFPPISSVNSESWSVYAISTMGDPSSLGGVIFQEATLGVGAYITGGVVGATSFRFNTLSGNAGKVVVTNGDQVMSTSISAAQLGYITGLTSQASGIGQTNIWSGIQIHTVNVSTTGSAQFIQPYNAGVLDVSTLVNRATLDSAISAIPSLLPLSNTWTGAYNQFNGTVSTMGSNKFIQPYNAGVLDVSTLVNRATLDSAISAIPSLLPLSNTWTGALNSFTNPITAYRVGSFQGYLTSDVRRIAPIDLSANTHKPFFGTYANDAGGGPFADIVGMNGWADGSGGASNLLMLSKSGIGMRLYQGTFGSISPFTTYKDVQLVENNGDITMNGTLAVGNRLLGSVDASPTGNFWMGLRGSGSEGDRLAIAIAGNATTGSVSLIGLNKPVSCGSSVSIPTGNLDVGTGVFNKVGTTAGYGATIIGGDASRSPYMEFFAAGLRRLYLGYADTSDVNIWAENGVNMNFGANGATRMKITPAGNVEIGENITMGITKLLYLYNISPTNNAGITCEGSGDMVFFTGTAGTATRLRIAAGGTATFSNALGVNGNFTASANFTANNSIAGINGGNPYAIPNGFMATGSLSIGDMSKNYGGGYSWTANTAGLMLECLDNTEIMVHDAGARVTSLMYYNGIANTITMGRDAGWGITDVAVRGVLTKLGTTTGYDVRLEGGTATNSGYINFVQGGASRGYLGNASGTDLDLVAQNGAQLNFYTAGVKNLKIDTTGDITMTHQRSLFLYNFGASNNAGFKSEASGDLSIFTGTAGVATRMTIDRTGKVAIGTAPTTYQLEVLGTLKFGASATPVYVGTAGTIYWQNPNGTNTHFGYPSGGGSANYIRGTQTYVDTPIEMRAGCNVLVGEITCAGQPFCIIGDATGGASIGYGAGQVFGGLTRLTAYTSVGMTNSGTSGWNDFQGRFYFTKLGKWQMNWSFYWNNFAAGSRAAVFHFNSVGTLIETRYCALNGGGIGADTTQSYSSLFYGDAGDWLETSFQSGSGTLYFGGIDHTHLTFYFHS